MATIAQLDVIYSANTRPLTRGLKDAKRQSQTATKSIVRGAGRMARGFRGTLNSVVNLRSAIGVLAGSAGIGLLVRNQMRAIDTSAKFADMIGVSTRELTGLQHAAEVTSGVTGNQFNMALQRMTRRLAEAANGTGEAKDAIAELGLEADKLNQLGPAAAFRRIAGAMQQVDSQGDRVRIAFKLFDSEGAKLVNTLNAGTGAIDKLTQEADELGLSFNRIEAAQIEQANDAITRMRGAFTAVSRQLTIQLAPILTGVADRVRGMASEGRIFGNTMAESMEGTITAIGFLADSVEGVKRVFQVTGRVAALAFLGIQEGALVTADYIINWPTRAANDLIGVLNKIPGMDIDSRFGMSGLGERVNSELQTVRGAVNAAQEDIHSILMEPMPSTAIKQFVADTQAEIEKAQRNRGPIGLPSATDDEEEQNTELFDSLIETTEQVETILAEHELRKKNIHQNSQGQLLRNHIAFLDAMEKAEQSSGATQVGIMTNAFAQITAAGAQHNKEMFEANKAAGIANAIVSTYQGAAKALEWGWPMGPIFAGLITAAGMAKVKAIQSQSFTGGGGAAPSVSAGGGVPAVQDVGNQGQSQQQESLRTVDITVRRNSRRSGWSDEEVQDMMEQIGEQLGDGAKMGKVRIG